jgi:membrane-associated phospholipid phosphatase
VGRLRLSNAGAVSFAAAEAVGAATERGLVLAHVISLVCLPPLLAIATLVALSSHFIADPSEATRVALVSSFFIAVAPAAYVGYLLKRNKINGGIDLALREERLRPYLVGAVSCLLGLAVLLRLSAPQSVSVLALCYGVNALLMALITRRWKISAHAAGAAMPVTALLSAFGTAALPFAIVLPVVCWARVRAQMHTVAQVCAGALLGCLMTWVQIALLGPAL